MRFDIVDVFAERKYNGNQLAVVRGGSDLEAEEMQKIAREFNFAETTFIISEEEVDGGYYVRIFTPREELPFAGHPTLGTASIIRTDIAARLPDRIVLNLKVGPIEVFVDEEAEDVLWMRQNPPRFGTVHDSSSLAPVLGLDEGDFNPDFPIQTVSTGLPSLIIPLRSLQEVKKARIRSEAYERFLETSEARLLLIFSTETYNRKTDLNVRVFAGDFGVPEDPATGSANGNLGGYLARSRFFGTDSVDVLVEQGYEIGRPSLLRLRARRLNSEFEVLVGGKVQRFARGQIE